MGRCSVEGRVEDFGGQVGGVSVGGAFEEEGVEGG